MTNKSKQIRPSNNINLTLQLFDKVHCGKCYKSLGRFCGREASRRFSPCREQCRERERARARRHFNQHDALLQTILLIASMSIDRNQIHGGP